MIPDTLGILRSSSNITAKVVCSPKEIKLVLLVLFCITNPSSIRVYRIGILKLLTIALKMWENMLVILSFKCHNKVILRHKYEKNIANFG